MCTWDLFNYVNFNTDGGGWGWEDCIAQHLYDVRIDVIHINDIVLLADEGGIAP